MNINKAIQLAFEHHKAGNLQKAEQIYKNILNKQPNNFDALFMLGVIYYQIKNIDSAIKYIEKALQIDPLFHEAYAFLGNIYHMKKQVDKAISYYQKAIQLNPHNSDAYYNLGNIFRERENIDEAVDCYQKAVKINPNNPFIYNVLGVAYRNKGQLEIAIKFYQKAIEINPNIAEVYNNLGSTLYEQGKLNDAISNFCRALMINSDYATAYCNLGNSLVRIGKIDDSIIFYNKALEINSGYAEAYYNLGMALKEQNKTDEALTNLNKAVNYNPNFIKARFAYCMSQLKIIYPNQSSIQSSRNRYQEELFKLQKSISLETKQDICAAAEAVGIHQPFYLTYQGFNDRELQRIYGELVCNIMALRYPEFANCPPMPSYSYGEPLRVGFVSGYFCLHSNWKVPIKGWIENLDKKRFKLYGYYTGKVKDEETSISMQYFSRFVEDIYCFEDLCKIIHNDNLHIIIYPEIGMNSMTARLAALRLSPIQCASWGHANTTGLPTIDYYLSSDLMEPPNAEDHYTEQLIRLPNLSVYYEPLDKQPAYITRDKYSLRQKSILYLCSHTLPTHLPQYDDVYPRIAQQVGDCQFLFISRYQSNAVTEQFCQRISNTFSRFNLRGEDHLIFLPHLDQEHYLAINFLSDIYLDTMEWSGCNSSFEAITCDLPIVTLPGKLMRGRHSTAILTMMGLKEMIAESIDDYIKIAVRLGKDSKRRLKISEKIAENKHLVYRDKTCITALEDFLVKAMKERMK